LSGKKRKGIAGLSTLGKRNGENIATVQKGVRHRRVSTTIDIYGHLDQRDADEAISRLPESEGPEELWSALSEEERGKFTKLLKALQGGPRTR